MAFPRPKPNNKMRNTPNTPARQRLIAARGRMFPQQNPGLTPPPQVQAAAQAQPQSRAATAPKPQYTAEQTAALQGLSGQFANLEQGVAAYGVPQPAPGPQSRPNPQQQALQGLSDQFANLEQGVAAYGVQAPTQPPTGTPPAPVGPGNTTPQDTANAPYMSEEYLRVQAAEEARKQRQLALINQQRQALGIGYGLGEFGGSAESNPYSRATLLQRNYEQNQRASTNSMAASGQLYSGSLSNARNSNRFNYDVGYDSMRKQYDAALAKLSQGELDAQTRYDDALEAALRKSVNQGLRDEEPTPEEADQPKRGGGSPQKKKVGGGSPQKKKVIGASKKRITQARKRVGKLRKAKAGAKNPKQKKQITKRIQNNKQVVKNNQKRIANVRQDKPQGQGIKPRPKAKPKKGKK